MRGRNRVRALLVLPRAVLTYLGLSAVIAGILAMHIWMGGHGPAAHGHTVPVGPVPAVAEFRTVNATEHSEHSGSHHSATSPGVADVSESAHGCMGSCKDDGAMLGLCVLAMIVVMVLAFLIPAGRLVPGVKLLRCPPRILPRPLSIPTPSLIRLCISRT